MQERTEIAGSAVRRPASARQIRPADPNQIAEVTIVIRRPNTQLTQPGPTREEIEKSLSADPADISAVTTFATRYGLKIIEVSPEKRMVRAEGSVQNMSRAFGVDLGYFDGPFLSYSGPLTVDSDVAGEIDAVLGLNQEPIAKSRSQS